MEENSIIALDESVRHKDKNGHLIVKESVLTKEGVSPYYGRDIPDYEVHGLDSGKIYYLYRPLSEIEKAIDTFKGKQLLLRHVQVSSKDTKKDLTVGAIGSDLKIKEDKLYGDMTFWDDYAIDLIENKKMEQLSAGYGYTLDLTSGEFNGVNYDGIMTNLHGNHTALVEKGRIGDDAIICDEKTVKDSNMTIKFKKGSMSKIAEAIKLAMDGELTEESVTEVADAIDEAREDEIIHDSDNLHKGLSEHFDESQVSKIMGVLRSSSDKKTPKAEDEKDENKESAKDSDKDDKKPIEDEDLEKEKDQKDKPAMDAALIEKNAVNRVTALFEARKVVEPLVGVVAMDSAENVYKFALEQKGIVTDGIHSSAYKPMVSLLQKQSASQSIAMDNALNNREVAKKLAPHIKL